MLPARVLPSRIIPLTAERDSRGWVEGDLYRRIAELFPERNELRRFYTADPYGTVRVFAQMVIGASPLNGYLYLVIISEFNNTDRGHCVLFQVELIPPGDAPQPCGCQRIPLDEVARRLNKATDDAQRLLRDWIV